MSSLYESILAAVYLDGGIEEARAFVARHPLGQEKQEENYISALQEYLQKQGLPLPAYSEIEKTGKDNAPTFRYVVTAQGKSGEGVGSSKHIAKQKAAKALLSILTNRK